MSDEDPTEHEDRSTESHEDSPETDDRATIRDGRDFEQEFRLSAAEAGRFLEDVGTQLQQSDDLTLSTDEWVLPFEAGESVELEIDFEGVGDPTLELEVEIPGKTDENAPAVE